jgi:hypothetical protein
MQILDLPSIPKEKRALQAIINEARHRAWLVKWIKRLVMLSCAAVFWFNACYDNSGQQQAAPAAAPVVIAGSQSTIYLPIIER